MQGLFKFVRRNYRRIRLVFWLIGMFFFEVFFDKVFEIFSDSPNSFKILITFCFAVFIYMIADGMVYGIYSGVKWVYRKRYDSFEEELDDELFI